MELDPEVVLPGQTWIGEVGMFGFLDSEPPIPKSQPSRSLEEDEGCRVPSDFGVRPVELELHPVYDAEPERGVDPEQDGDGALVGMQEDLTHTDEGPFVELVDSTPCITVPHSPSFETSPGTDFAMQRGGSATSSVEELTPSTSTTVIAQEEEEYTKQKDVGFRLAAIKKALRAVEPWLDAC